MNPREMCADGAGKRYGDLCAASGLHDLIEDRRGMQLALRIDLKRRRRDSETVWCGGNGGIFGGREH